MNSSDEMGRCDVYWDVPGFLGPGDNLSVVDDLVLAHRQRRNCLVWWCLVWNCEIHQPHLNYHPVQEKSGASVACGYKRAVPYKMCLFLFY